MMKKTEAPALTSTARKRLHSRSQPVGCWIRPVKRLALYARDGFACVWCGATVEDGISLCLDHAEPKSRGGTNEATNLCTSCKRCNDSRGNRSIEEFAVAVAGYLNHGVTAEAILAHVMACMVQELPMDEARTLIARRGSVLAACKREG